MSTTQPITDNATELDAARDAAFRGQFVVLAVHGEDDYERVGTFLNRAEAEAFGHDEEINGLPCLILHGASIRRVDDPKDMVMIGDDMMVWLIEGKIGAKRIDGGDYASAFRTALGFFEIV